MSATQVQRHYGARNKPKLAPGRRRLTAPVTLTRWDEPIPVGAVIDVRMMAKRSGLAWVMGPGGRCGWMAQSRIVELSEEESNA